MGKCEKRDWVSKNLLDGSVNLFGKGLEEFYKSFQKYTLDLLYES